MSGIQPGDMRAANVQWTRPCSQCGETMEERTLDQGNVWVHIKTSPQGNQQISETCFAPEPIVVRQPKIGDTVLVRVDNQSETFRPGIVTNASPELGAHYVEVTLFADNGPLPMVACDNSRFGANGVGSWRFYD